MEKCGNKLPFLVAKNFSFSNAAFENTKILYGILSGFIDSELSYISWYDLILAQEAARRLTIAIWIKCLNSILLILINFTDRKKARDSYLSLYNTFVNFHVNLYLWPSILTLYTSRLSADEDQIYHVSGSFSLLENWLKDTHTHTFRAQYR